MAAKRPPSAIRQRRGLLRICVILALTPPLFILELRPDSVLKVYFSRDGLHLLSKHEGRAEQYWEAATGRRISERRGRAALAPGEEFYISWPYFERSPKEPGVVLVYGPRGPMRLDHGAEVIAVDLSQDRGTLASGTKARTVHLWDVATSRELRRFRGHEGPVTAVALSPDGRVLASASEDKTVRLWDITGSQAVRVLSGHTRAVRWVAFSLDSRLLASEHQPST
jgi:WD40 repeat protein